MSTIATDLAAALGTTRRSGDFFAAGKAELLAPRLEVDGVGPIALPLLPFQAEQLIAAAERAPYGRGQPPDHSTEQDVVASLLNDWAAESRSRDDDAPAKLVYPLEHAYTPAELGFEALKGADAGVAKVAVAAAHRAGFDLHLAVVSIQESGMAEHTGNSRRGRGWHDDDGDEMEAGEVFERTVTASDWRRPGGEPSPLTEIPVEEEEFSPPEAFEDREPDEQHFREATGNEGASFERTYRRAALVLWPRDRLLAVINQAGLRVTLPYLADLAERWAAGDADHDSALWRQAHELSAHMVTTWTTAPWQPRGDPGRTATGQMLTLLTQLEDIAHLDAFLATIAERGGFDPGDSTAIVNAIRLLPPERAAFVTTRLVSAAAGMSLAACGALLAHAAPLAVAVVADAAKALVDALPDSLPRDTWRRGPGVEPGFVIDLFTALARIDAALADRAAAYMLAWRTTYDFDRILVPAVRTLCGSPDTAAIAAVRRLRDACVAHLDARVAEPLDAPRDWRRASALGCTCAHCSELSRFLDDPLTARWVFRANEAERGHVESTVRNARVDVDTMTERRGRPYSLICTKNQASYERRRMQRANDLADLQRLNV